MNGGAEAWWIKAAPARRRHCNRSAHKEVRRTGSRAVVFRASSFVLCPERWNGDME